MAELVDEDVSVSESDSPLPASSPQLHSLQRTKVGESGGEIGHQLPQALFTLATGNLHQTSVVSLGVGP